MSIEMIFFQVLRELINIIPVHCIGNVIFLIQKDSLFTKELIVSVLFNLELIPASIVVQVLKRAYEVRFEIFEVIEKGWEQ